jgi:hypothetical protein
VRNFLANYRLGKVQLHPSFEAGKTVQHMDLDDMKE